MLVSVLYVIPRTMLAKTVTYNSQNYAGTLGSGLTQTFNKSLQALLFQSSLRVCCAEITNISSAQEKGYYVIMYIRTYMHKTN